jgi:hypothetical protein
VRANEAPDKLAPLCAQKRRCHRKPCPRVQFSVALSISNTSQAAHRLVDDIGFYCNRNNASCQFFFLRLLHNITFCNILTIRFCFSLWRGPAMTDGGLDPCEGEGWAPSRAEARMLGKQRCTSLLQQFEYKQRQTHWPAPSLKSDHMHMTATQADTWTNT